MGIDATCGYGGLMSETAVSLLPSAAWARVRILLNLGQIEEAATAASEAARRTVWCDDALAIGGPDVHALADLPPGWCFLDPAANLAVINDEVVDELCGAVALFQFVRVCNSLTAPVFRWYDVENWRILDGMDEAEAADS
jgi:hypothetical protein